MDAQVSQSKVVEGSTNRDAYMDGRSIVLLWNTNTHSYLAHIDRIIKTYILPHLTLIYMHAIAK